MQQRKLYVHSFKDHFMRGMKEVAENWAWLMVMGICLAIIGIYAIGYTIVASMVSVLVFGLFFVVGGIIHILRSFRSSGPGMFFLSIMAGLLYVVIGYYMIAHPLLSLASISLLLAMMFMAVGLFRIVFSLTEKSEHKGLSVFGGIVTFLLGAMIMLHWPISSLFVIGIFIGVEMLFHGISMISLSFILRDLAKNR